MGLVAQIAAAVLVGLVGMLVKSLLPWWRRVQAARRFPGPEWRFPSGNGWYFGRGEQVVERILEQSIKYPNGFCRWLNFWTPTVYFPNPRDVKTILTSPAVRKFSEMEQKFVGPLTGRTFILTNSGEEWRFARKFLTPLFHFKSVDYAVAKAVQCTNVLANKWQARAALHGADTVHNVEPDLPLWSADVAVRVTTGLELNLQESTEETPLHRTLRAFENGVQRFSRLLAENPLNFIDWYYYRTPVGKQLKADGAAGRAFAIDLVNKRLAAVRKGEEVPGDLLSSLVQLVHEGTVTTEFAVDHMTGFLFAATDTSQTSLGFILWELAKHPDVQTRCRDEAFAVLGDDMPNQRTLGEMPFINAVVKEVLRIYAPVITLVRVCDEDITLQGVTLPAGSLVNVPHHAVHHDPKLWTDPSEFRPDRFMPGGEASTNDPFAYIPFNAGPRICIGMNMALADLKAAIAVLVRRFELRASTQPKHQLKATLKALHTPENGVHIATRPLRT